MKEKHFLPYLEPFSETIKEITLEIKGMSDTPLTDAERKLRNEFAIAAMNAYLSIGSVHLFSVEADAHRNANVNEYCKGFYEWADAMLKASKA